MTGRLPTRICAALLALAFAGNACADARADLHAAFRKNMSAKTYRATMTDLGTGAQVSTVEFQAPDRYRIKAAGMSSVIADGQMFLTINGKPMKVPLQPGMLDKFRSDSAWKKMESDTLITDAGPTLLGTEATRKFHWITGGKQPSTGDAWVSTKTGYVVQVETAEKPGAKKGAVRVRYSDFNDASIKILAPK